MINESLLLGLDALRKNSAHTSDLPAACVHVNLPSCALQHKDCITKHFEKTFSL